MTKVALLFSTQVDPHQTKSFRLLGLGFGVAALWILHWLRMKQIAGRAKADERTRLARDLQDTLLQTLQGSKMVADDALDGEAGRYPGQRAVLEKLSEWLGQAIQEGRAVLYALRNEDRT